MFSNRNSTRKPDGDFISRFQQAFSDVVPRRGSQDSSNSRPNIDQNGDSMMPLTTIEHDIKIPTNDRTPRNMQELGLTPSWMEPGSFSMMPFAGQHSGLYTPNSGGMGAIYHNQAGDLHTPTGMHMITPLSLTNPMNGAHHHPGNGFEPFNPQFLASMPEINPYAQQASYAPSAFMHHNSNYNVMDESLDDSSVNDMNIDSASNVTASTDFSGPTGPTEDMSYAKGEKFRFNVSLRAPTAMVKNLREIPVTYLNKGQAYNLSVTDSSPPVGSSRPIRYRTYVRISFEEEEQRARPSACWQLWKEGRGSSEAHQRGGKLLAVEYVDPLQGGGDAHKHRQVQVEKLSVDGFCVTWTANPMTGSSDCNIPVRFNFLSTDFSHSKGVKGIPVRLCAKTELVSPGQMSGAAREVELSYCKVKLFRDHGAERKMSNDVAHVKKTIDKLKQQISQAEMGGGFAKRKRGSNATAKGPDRSMKMTKHKRTWSQGSDNSGTPSLEDDLQSKLNVMQEMFSSTRSVSVFGLRGDQQDDPDLYPIRLPGDGETVKFETVSRTKTGDFSSAEALIPSPESSNPSENSPHAYSRPMTIQKIPSANQTSRGFLEAVGIDSTYRPPSERPPKPIACFYVRFSGNEENPQDYYRAIYLTERTVQDLVKQISSKQQIDPVRIVSIKHVNEKGMQIMVDDDVVRELPEGQDMVVDISTMPGSNVDAPGSPIEIKLTF
ncbi:hypothetical protein PENARI_c008G07912 [Penicillium arizonense]|uniref:Grh/CP2 DB domain-containing protein n=1 Tax=Penicillium arizonense TaxID=1835702 RepID=A0A1F5LJW1_PENAI|nr:hypothetical protein PENARI_c008G07912 [Penicillium arizonense]OGE53386.1 hypothetical protein PENARI_c008G07912 [Penicillium arizonense]